MQLAKVRNLHRFYAYLPCGTKVTIPEDTLEDFKVLYKSVKIHTFKNQQDYINYCRDKR